MDNLIRHHRKLQGMTQAELADRLGTTTQSVSRLETGVMTLSTDWLERLGAALRVHPIALLPQPGAQTSPCYVLHNPAGISLLEPMALHAEHGAQHPVGVQLMTDCGPYRVGAVLVGDRLDLCDRAQAIGRDCLVGFAPSGVGVRRVLRVHAAPLVADLVALIPGTPPDMDCPVRWLAPIRAEIRLF